MFMDSKSLNCYVPGLALCSLTRNISVISVKSTSLTFLHNENISTSSSLKNLLHVRLSLLISMFLNVFSPLHVDFLPFFAKTKELVLKRHFKSELGLVTALVQKGSEVSTVCQWFKDERSVTEQYMWRWERTNHYSRDIRLPVTLSHVLTNSLWHHSVLANRDRL